MMSTDRTFANRTIQILFIAAWMLSSGCSGVELIRNAIVAPGTIAGVVEGLGYESEAIRADAEDRGPGAEGTVLVLLESIDARPSRRPGNEIQHVVIRDGLQEPEIQLLRPGQSLRIQNLDSIYHELFTVGPRNHFQIRLKGRTQGEVIQLEEIGFVRVYCRLHPRELFAFVVSDALDFVWTTDGARFEIVNVRSGDYRIRAVSLDGESGYSSIRVDPGQRLDLTLQLSPRAKR